MNILLRILVILTLLLNGVSLWFAKETYAKRNLLIDYKDASKDFFERIAKQFEKDEPEEVSAADREARDISPVSLANADITPDRSDFWETYKMGLEKIDAKNTYAIPSPDDLDAIYNIDPETNKPKLDSRGNPDKEGAPMAVALEEIMVKAQAQRKRLNDTRTQLTKLREEYEEAVADLNAVKKQGREDKKTIQAREETIAQLEADKSRLEGEIADLKSQIETLEQEKQALQADLDKANEEMETLRAENEKYKEIIEKITREGTRGPGSGATAVVGNILAGVKGTIVRVDNDYNFCLVKLTEEAFIELVGEDGGRELPEVEYLIRRPGNNTTTLGKVRLRTITKELHTIYCDILADWKQDDIRKGDEIFYLD